MHPRIYINKTPERLPLSTSMGCFFSKEKVDQSLQDDLALGILHKSYFNLLKGLIYYMCLATLLSVPLFVLYGMGEDNFSIFSKYTLGNLG